MSSYSTDPALYIYTSLTAGSSHIVTATSRLETILRANRIPFKAVDIATDEKARMLWGRRAGKDESGRLRKLPGLVQEGLVLGDIVEIEDWNEYGELKQHVKIYYDEHTIPSIHNKPKDPPMKFGPAKPAAPPAAAAVTTAASAAAAPPAAPPLPKTTEPTSTASAAKKEDSKKPETAAEKATLPIRSLADEAAQKAKELRLQSLREKVHGSKEKKEGTAQGKTEETKAQTTDAKTESAPSGAGNAPPAAAAAASGVAVTSSQADAIPHVAETMQSPTTARWRPSEPVEPLTTTSHRGSVVASASEEEIKAVEQAEAIPEASSEEEDDEDGEDEEETEEEKDAKGVKGAKDDGEKDDRKEPSQPAAN